MTNRTAYIFCAVIGLVVIPLILWAVVHAIASPGGAASLQTLIGGAIILGLFVAAFILYFLPTIMANSQHHNIGAIFALNLFLGWLIVPWVIALVWAVSKPAQVVLAAPPLMPDGAVRCPFCDEPIRSAAVKCKHCGSALGDAKVS